MNVFYKIISLIFLCCSIVGCSCLQPVYTEKNKQEIFSLIELSAPKNVYEVDLIHRLEEWLTDNTEAEKKYILNVSTEYHTSALALERNSDVLHSSIKLILKYQLVDKCSQNIVTSGNLELRGKHIIVDSNYNSYLYSEQLHQDLASKGADSIMKNIIIHFNKNNAS